MMSRANGAAARVYGLAEAELIGRPIACGAFSDSQATASLLLAETRAHGSWQGAFGVAGDAGSAAIKVRATLLCDDDGHPLGVALAFLGQIESPWAGPGTMRSQAQVRAAQRTAGVGMWEWDPATDQLLVSESFTALLGMQRDVVLRMSDALAAMAPDDRDQVRADIGQAVSGECDSFVSQYRIRAADGEVCWLEACCVAHRDESGQVVRIYGVTQDVTERHHQREQAYLQTALLDEVDVAVVVTGCDGQVRTWSAGAERLFGWMSEEAIGRRTGDFLAVNGASKLQPARSSESGRWDGETTYRRKDGSSFPGYIRTRLVPSLDGQDTAVVGVVIDVTKQRESERQLRQARDYLRAVTDSIGEGMFTLDVDGRVTYMNPAAERQLGWSLDEIEGAVMHEISHHRRADGSAYPVSQCPILEARRDGKMVRVDDDLFVRRDGSQLPVAYTAAPFATQNRAEGCVVVFEDITERKAQARLVERDLEKLVWVRRIREALAEDRFVLHAQPIIELESGREVQHELLIRMREPTGDRVIAPGAFLPVAEELGFITDIDRWVITRSAEIAASGLAVELNVSAASIGEPGLIEFIRNAIDQAGADPGHLVLEITETALVEDEAAARRFVHAMHEMGCKVALDDFGTGYGGLTYVKQLPVDYLKIDIEFVRDVVDSAASRNVVQAIVGLARAFDLRTVAEGVEDELTLDLLRDLGVDYAQGYHIGRPGPIADPVAGRSGHWSTA
jgi:PAS domain S-box-containing protein